MHLNDTMKKIGGSHLPFGNVMEYGGGREN
jgi:hypothetical protein